MNKQHLTSLEQSRKLKIPGFPNYSIDSEGNVFGFRGKRLKLQKNRQGYYQVHLYDGEKHKYKRVHRIVLEAFQGECPKGKEGCHNNGIKTDNRLSNLRWDTPKNNHADKHLHGTIRHREKHHRAKLNCLKARVAFHLRTIGWTCARIGRLYGVTSRTISTATSSKSWGINIKQKIYPKMNPLKVGVAKHLKSLGWRDSKIAKLFGVANSTISMALRGETWNQTSSSNYIRKV